MERQRILFYTDLSPKSDRVFPLAVELARLYRSAHLHVVHVLHSPYRLCAEIMGPGLAMNLNPGMMDVADRCLRGRYEPLLQGYRDVSFHVRAGVAGEELLRFVRGNSVHQIVAAASVAQQRMENMSVSLQSFLIERSPCPVLLVAPGRDCANAGRERMLSQRHPGAGNNVLDLGGFRRRIQAEVQGGGSGKGLFGWS